MDPLVETEDCVPLMHHRVHYPITTIETDNHLINITDGIQPEVAVITNEMTLANPLKMNLEMKFSDLKINKKRDFPERTIFMEANTRGDNKIKKEIFMGMKKACKFNVPNLSYEFVFDHGYAGDTYDVLDLVEVFNSSTINFAPNSVHENWSDSCNIDMIIF
jgi:hypothetical protein